MSLRPPTRVFRAETPSDVTTASIVASQLPPGRDLLILSTTSSQADVDGYLTCLHTLAALHEWSAVVDISAASLDALEISQAALDPNDIRMPTVADRIRRSRDTARRVRALRRLLAPAVGVGSVEGRRRESRLARAVGNAINEIYIAYLRHPDAGALIRIAPHARVHYFPHTLCSIERHEIGTYAGICTPQRTGFLRGVANVAKRVVFGQDAVPVVHLPIDAGYTFGLSPDWSPQNHKLDDMLNRATMERLFARLPAHVQVAYRDLADQCEMPVGLLLLTSEDLRWEERIDVHVELARHLANAGARSIVIKPHSRNNPDWVREIVNRIVARLPEMPIQVITKHYFYPIEIVAAPFELAGCAGLASTSLTTLPRIYGGTAFCPEAHLRETYAYDVVNYDNYLRWFDEHRGEYVAV